MFESSVVLDGTKTYSRAEPLAFVFESSVVLDGTKTQLVCDIRELRFESSVVLDGTETAKYRDTFLKVSLLCAPSIR